MTAAELIVRRNDPNIKSVEFICIPGPPRVESDDDVSSEPAPAGRSQRQAAGRTFWRRTPKQAKAQPDKSTARDLF
jgi:hypothetical protein